MSVQTDVRADHGAAREQRDLRELFRAHTSPAFHQLLRSRHVKTNPGNPLSVPTCEKVPTSDPDRAENHPETYRYVEQITAARDALQASIGRSRERAEKVIALIGAGEVAHAKRLAYCRRKSVQLECPPMAGGCGSDDNFVPVSCGSRLCPDCMKKQMGKKVGQYRLAVSQWGHPTTFRLSLPKRVEPTEAEIERAVDALRGAHGRLRRRVVPPDGPGWSWKEWKRALIAVGETDLARRWQKRYVDQDKGIPFSEIVPTGFYGIDIKQGDDRTLNVHMHVLADVPWLPQAALSHLWGELIDAPVVDIRRVDGRGDQDLESAVMEMVAYAAKPPEWETVEGEVAYLKALKGSKLVQPFGDLHGNTPTTPRLLCCGTCEVAPAYWNYQGVVDGRYETVIVEGDGPDGDRPPPGEHPENQPAVAFGDGPESGCHD